MNRAINILCLHGLRHNSQLLSKSMATMMKRLGKKNICFDFVESPIKYDNCTELPSERDNQSEYKQWWSATRDNALTVDKYDTYKESLKVVADAWNKKMYHGILGFSQGSVLAQLFCYLNDTKPQFAILCSPSSISDKELVELYKTKLNVPTCIMFGEKDALVTCDVSLKVAENFVTVDLIKHPGGHYVSTTTETTDQLEKFIKTVTTSSVDQSVP